MYTKSYDSDCLIMVNKTYVYIRYFFLIVTARYKGPGNTAHQYLKHYVTLITKQIFLDVLKKAVPHFMVIRINESHHIEHL